MEDEADIIAELERLDRFLEGDEPGERPIDALRKRGMEFPMDDATLDDGALHTKLWEAIEGLASLGVILDSTDHLSDRELYRWMVSEVLTAELLLPGACGGHWNFSPIGSGSEEENEIYLRFYADEVTREDWRRRFNEVLPRQETPPFDRDRFLPPRENERMRPVN